METDFLQGHLREFTAPSGFKYTIREQNGEDDDLISNSNRAKDLRNLSDLISAIVVKTNATPNGVLNPEQAHRLPSNDRYCILINNRIHSIGDKITFSYDWGQDGGVVEYEQDLNEYIYGDYSSPLTEEEKALKPYAVKPYTVGIKDIAFDINGRSFKVDVLNGQGEGDMILRRDQASRNTTLKVRNLRETINEREVKVESFKNYTLKEMIMIREVVNNADPVFGGELPLQSPSGAEAMYNLLAIPSFFYPEER